MVVGEKFIFFCPPKKEWISFSTNFDILAFEEGSKIVISQ